MAFDKNSVPGLQGFGPQSRLILAETEGFFGWSAGKSSNVLFNVIGPNGAPVSGLTLTITYSGQGGAEILTYDESLALERLYPVNVAITVLASGPAYDNNSQTFTLATGDVKQLIIQLVGKAGLGYVTYARRRYLTP